MQVTSVNSTAASATSPQPADDTARRADDFARVLQNAFYGAGSKAVATGAQQASQDSTPRTETRPVERNERPAADRPVERSTEARQEQRPAERSDDTAKTDNSASRDQAAKPADKPAQKTEDKPAAQDTASKPVKDETAADAKPAEASKVESEAKADAGKTAADAGEDLADAKDETKPAVVAAPDAALILSLLQTQMPVAVVAVAPTATPAVEGEVAAPVVAPVAAAPVAAAPVAAAPVAAPQAPVDAAAAALAAAAAAAGQVLAEAAAPQAGVVDPATQDAAAKAAAQTATQALADAVAAQAGQQQKPLADATQTSVAALLSQQQTMSKEDFAAIQQALAARAQAQLQDDVKTVVAEPQQQVIAQPQVAVAVAPKSEGKSEKNGNLTVDVQTVSAVAPKTLVDQSALMSMQGDDDQADAALQQQQMQAQVQQQPVGAEVKFAATLQSQLVADAPQPLNPAAVQASPAHLVSQTGPAPAGQSAQAAQASHAAQQQTLARNLNAYIPAGEQVAVQIKKGAAEGIDKISIRLDPGNLGNVEIKMEVGHDGRLMAVIAADKPETLQMLQKDAASLEQSLRDAGLKTDQQSLSFSLRDQNQAQSGREGRDGNGYGRQRGRGTEEYADTGRIDPAQVAAAQAQRAAAARGGLDIKI